MYCAAGQRMKSPTPTMNDVAILRAILAAKAPSRQKGSSIDQSVLERLLAVAPKILRHQRKTTLFEAMHVLDLEAPHSDFLAWLIDPSGPLSGNWLLKALLERVAPEQVYEDDPTVEREVAIENGRVDILVNWDSFKLVIENKVWSDEGDAQIARYLRSGEIAGGCAAKILYLSPRGRPPASIGANDRRVVAISYRDLVALIDFGLSSNIEPTERGRMFALEFRNCVLRLLKVRYDMSQPQISESTKIFLGNARRLAEIKAHAIEESAEFLQWMYSETERRLNPLLGPKMVVQRGKYVVLFRLPEWRRGQVGFGFYFDMDIDPQKRLISEPRTGPWAGVGAWRIDDSLECQGCQEVVEAMSSVLKRSWPHPKDLPGVESDDTMALWREIPIPSDGDIEKWAENTIEFFEELASTLVPTLEGVGEHSRAD